MSLSDQSMQTSIKRVFSERKEALAGCRILLFGSRARGSHTSRSDYDLGILRDKPLDLETFYEIEDALDRLPTLNRIDWVDLNRASERLRSNARNEGKILYEA